MPAIDRGWLAFDVEPANAAIRLNGKQIAVGRFADSLEVREHAFAVSAPDYHDSAFVVTADPLQARDLHVALRPRLGSLNVYTEPPGADVRVDGVVRDIDRARQMRVLEVFRRQSLDQDGADVGADPGEQFFAADLLIVHEGLLSI